jgi:RNA polymerase sigma factor (sigma-70 family)
VPVAPDTQPRSTTLPADFGAFYAEHSERLLVFFARRTFDVEVARDLTAETFAEALRTRSRFRGATGEEAGGWLYGIARHKLSHFVRRGVAERRSIERLGVRVPEITPDEHARVVELAGLADLRSVVAQEFRSLSAEQQAAVQLRVVEELSYGEVAERLHISEPTARARVSRGLRQLASALDGITPQSEVTA